jgi:hypothetical protein
MIDNDQSSVQVSEIQYEAYEVCPSVKCVVRESLYLSELPFNVLVRGLSEIEHGRQRPTTTRSALARETRRWHPSEPSQSRLLS